MKELKESIIDEIRGNVSEETIHLIEDFILQEKYRWAFIELQKIKDSNEWQTTERFLSLLEKFWWIYAN